MNPAPAKKLPRAVAPSRAQVYGTPPFPRGKEELLVCSWPQGMIMSPMLHAIEAYHKLNQSIANNGILDIQQSRPACGLETLLEVASAHTTGLPSANKELNIPSSRTHLSWKKGHRTC